MVYFCKEIQIVSACESMPTCMYVLAGYIVCGGTDAFVSFQGSVKLESR